MVPVIVKRWSVSSYTARLLTNRIARKPIRISCHTTIPCKDRVTRLVNNESNLKPNCIYIMTLYEFEISGHKTNDVKSSKHLRLSQPLLAESQPKTTFSESRHVQIKTNFIGCSSRGGKSHKEIFLCQHKTVQTSLLHLPPSQKSMIFPNSNVLHV